MNNKIKKFNDFLEDLKQNDPVIECIQAGFNMIFEDATKEKVEELKDKFPPAPKDELSTTDEVIDDLEDEGEIPPAEEVI